MPIRVISGIAKGRRLKLVPGDSTRPVMDRVKEALFNIIGPRIVGARFLDLFAGTGSVGIEALSRGARHALFIEIDRSALRTIHENLQITRLGERADVRPMNAFSLLKQAPEVPYDYIYVAPPQFKGIWLEVLQALDNNPAWIEPETTVIVQIAPSELKDGEMAFQHLTEVDRRKYGKTMLLFLERSEADDAEEADEADEDQEGDS